MIAISVTAIIVVVAYTGMFAYLNRCDGDRRE